MKDQGRPGLDYPCPVCRLIGLASPLCHEGREQSLKRQKMNETKFPDYWVNPSEVTSTEITPLNALRRLDRHIGKDLDVTGGKDEPELEEAIMRLWKFLIEGK
jgi:hypothetical protein